MNSVQTYEQFSVSVNVLGVRSSELCRGALSDARADSEFARRVFHCLQCRRRGKRREKYACVDRGGSSSQKMGCVTSLDLETGGA